MALQTYLITYGADNDLATFEAESISDAINKFIDWEPVSDDPSVNREAINQIAIVTPVTDWEDS